MRNILNFDKFLNEGVKSENIISLMRDIILERIDFGTIENNFNKKYNNKPTIEYTYKTFFNKYKNEKFIKDMFDFFKKEDRNPKIIFRFEKKFSYYEYQTENIDTNGFYNPNTSDIQINIWSTKLNTKQINQTLTHELRHLYDDVVRNGEKYDNEDDISYKDKPSEIRARITGFINSYTDWEKSIDDIIKDVEDVIKSDNYNRKKLLKLIYTIKKSGIKKHTIIPTKKFEGRKSDIDSFIKEMNIYNLYVSYNKDHRIVDINNEILSINTIDEDSGDLNYPLIDILLDIYNKKNISITISTNNLELVDVLKSRYKLEVIKIREKNHWSKKSLKIKFLLSKNKKIPNYEKISDISNVVDYDKIIKDIYYSGTAYSDTLEKRFKELGLSDSYMITCLQQIINNGKYFYMYKSFYDKWEHLLNLKDVDIHTFEVQYDDNSRDTIYIINAEKDNTILMDRLKKALNYKKIK